MYIQSVTILKRGDTAEQNQSGETETLVYQCIVDDEDSTPLEVARATHGDMPNYGDTHVLNSALKVISKSPVRAPAKEGGGVSQRIWNVTVKWAVPQTAGGGSGPTGETDNSQNVRVRMRSAEEVLNTQVSQDDSATPIRNAVGDLHPDPIEIIVNDTVIEVEYESDSMDNELWDDVVGKINIDAITLTLPQGDLTYSRTFPTKTVRLRTADREVILSRIDPTVHKWHNNVQLIYRPDTWDKKLPEKGYRWNVTGGSDSSTKITEYKDHAEYLDASGFKLGAGSPIVLTAPIQCYKTGDLAVALSTI